MKTHETENKYSDPNAVAERRGDVETDLETFTSQLTALISNLQK